MADPDFPEGVRQLPKVLLFFKFFAENCMKMKQFGAGGRPGTPPWIRQCIGMHTCFTIYLDLHSRVQGFGASNQGDPRHVQMG